MAAWGIDRCFKLDALYSVPAVNQKLLRFDRIYLSHKEALLNFLPTCKSKLWYSFPLLSGGFLTSVLWDMQDASVFYQYYII